MQPFVPQSLPLQEVQWEELIASIGRANRALARFDGVLAGLTNPNLLFSPLMTQEAVLSSRIEGTTAGVNDVLRFEAGEPPHEQNLQQDIYEIINYRNALNYALAALQAQPFSRKLLLELHTVLLKSGRGQDKEPGRIRIEQNWIGVHGRPIEEAFHVPPEAHLLPQFIDNWLEYYRGESPDPLVQLAVIHAQFEILHPFMDGNGRIGRLLVPLFLYEKRILSEPVFYLSAYLEAHRDEYEQGLRVLSGLDSWNQWILFFLRAIESQAEENAAKARDIQTLYESLKRTILDLTRSQYAVPLLDAMFAKPIFRSSELFDRPEMPSQPAVTHMLNQLKEAGVLTLVREAAGRRPQVLMLEKLLSIAEGREVRLPAVAQVPA